MNTSIQVLNFQQNTIRTTLDAKGEMWFLANDVCNILGYTNSRRTVSLHCKEKGVTKRYTPTESGNQEMVYINEPNLYRLIIKSRKTEAEQFEEWVMEEVLPTIRKTGSYSGSPKTKKALPNGLTIEQQEEIKKFQRELCAAVPKEKQRNLSIALWSAVKAKFGVGYKEVAPEHYLEVMSLMARVAVEKGVLYGEVLDKEQPTKPTIQLKNHDYGMARFFVNYGAGCASIVDLHCALNQLSEIHTAFMKMVEYRTLHRGISKSERYCIDILTSWHGALAEAGCQVR